MECLPGAHNRTYSNTRFSFPFLLGVSLLYLKENNFFLHLKEKMFVCLLESCAVALLCWLRASPPPPAPPRQTRRVPRAPGVPRCLVEFWQHLHALPI